MNFFLLFLFFRLFYLPVFAQFGNIFEQLFQHQEDSNHASHEHHSGIHNSAGSFDKHQRLMDQTECSNYFCSNTFECVLDPKDCSCPFLEDIKCPLIIPSSNSKNPIILNSFVCTRSPGCHQVQQALQFGSL